MHYMLSEVNYKDIHEIFSTPNELHSFTTKKYPKTPPFTYHHRRVSWSTHLIYLKAEGKGKETESKVTLFYFFIGQGTFIKKRKSINQNMLQKSR